MSEYENEVPMLIELLVNSPEGLTASEVFRIVSKKLPPRRRRYYSFWFDWIQSMVHYGIFTVSNEIVDHSGNKYLNKGKGPLEHRGKHYRLAEELEDKTKEEIMDVFFNTHV